ncbi:uncharacterized protein si:ch211-12e13.1 [Clupea harengus]|uniref:Uncharacterized protein si:ch211-12e13.1 n=1 Tax=Clupea harengus TaxID=7950 RepID=A0A6P3W0D6_CLUHA|nr:uncharacterized protein si:ch211-12e13.1 [Clupea harengus]
MDRYKILLLVAVPAYGMYAICASLCKSYRRSKCVVFETRRALPCYLYLYVRCKIKAFRKRKGQLYAHRDKPVNPTFTILNCRLKVNDLRWYCWATGYGWDYPDSVFRDIPLCFCDVLCGRLMAMVITSDDFRLSPQGLCPVRQTMRKFEPIDELRRASFRLEAGVAEYRLVDCGVEVDIWFKALRADHPVWESVVTMLSPRDFPVLNVQSLSNGVDGAVEMKSLEISVPLFAGLKSVWAFCDVSLKNLLVFPSTLGVMGRFTVHGLWMMSQCLAEIEKHKGADAVRAPLSVSVQFKQPLVLPRKVVIRFWEATDESCQQPRNVCRFQLEDYSRGTCYILGQVIREPD